MDNRIINVVAEDDHVLELAIRLAWSARPDEKATHYRVKKAASHTEYYGSGDAIWHKTEMAETPDGVETLVLLSAAEGDAIPLPYPLGLEDAIAFLKGWLRNADYSDEPDHDGDNGKGWRVFVDKWDTVMGYNAGILGIQPIWAIYGK